MEVKVQEGYKQTEVGLIPEEWSTKQASDIFTKIQDGTHFSPKIGGNDYLYITSKNIRMGKLNLITAEYIDKKQHKSIYKRCDVKKGDILLTKDGANTGNVAINILDEEFSLLSSVAFLRVDKKQGSADYYLQQIMSSSFQQAIQIAMSGNAITRLTLNKINKLMFFVPSKEEQIAIANALSDVDSLITSLEKLITKKRAIKTATMQQLLTGKKRLPPFDQIHTGYKQTELGEIPKDWEIGILEDVITFNNGAAHENVISKYGEYTVVNSKFISTEGAVAKYSNQLLCPTKKGNILMVMSDVPNGRAIAKCFFVDQQNKYTVNQRICSMEPVSVESKFLFYILNRNKFYLQFDDGVKQTNLRRQDVLKCPIQLPSYEEQVAISLVLNEMNKDVRALEKKFNKTKQIKQGMMQELLTGRTRLV